MTELPGVESPAKPGDGNGIAEEIAQRHAGSVPAAP